MELKKEWRSKKKVGKSPRIWRQFSNQQVKCLGNRWKRFQKPGRYSRSESGNLGTSISTHGALVRLCKQQLEFRPVVPPGSIWRCAGHHHQIHQAPSGIGSNNHGHMTEKYWKYSVVNPIINLSFGDIWGLYTPPTGFFCIPKIDVYLWWENIFRHQFNMCQHVNLPQTCQHPVNMKTINTPRQETAPPISVTALRAVYAKAAVLGL